MTNIEMNHKKDQPRCYAELFGREFAQSKCCGIDNNTPQKIIIYDDL